MLRIYSTIKQVLKQHMWHNNNFYIIQMTKVDINVYNTVNIIYNKVVEIKSKLFILITSYFFQLWACI